MPDNEVEQTVLKSISKPQDYFYKCPPRYNGWFLYSMSNVS